MPVQGLFSGWMPVEEQVIDRRARASLRLLPSIAPEYRPCKSSGQFDAAGSFGSVREILLGGSLIAYCLNRRLDPIHG
ncbi:hypothetical protein [Streptomyces sp. NBC_01238]|uniref:hypothetical protein n=1 Tax=Streptomyces sp. NBC_01238 TaxID=2903791 RepID=UPI00386B5BD8